MTDSLWTRYRAALDVKKDFKAVFFRDTDRYAVLDGARAITILGMVLFHVVYGVTRLLEDKVDTFIQSYPAYLNWTWQIQGSDPLFVMCGLLVSYSLFREYDKKGTIEIGRFYQNRLMRILPLFLFALVFYLPTDDDNINYLLSNLFFVSNYVEGHRQIIPVGWSLAVQMHFYFLLPGLVLLLFNIRWPIVAICALLFASALIRYVVVVGDEVAYETPFYNIIYDNDFGHLLSDKLYYDIEDRIGSFLIGVLVAYLHTYHGKAITAFFTRHVAVNALVLLAGIVMILVPLFIPVHDRLSFFYQNFNVDYSFWYLVLNRYVYSLGIGVILLLVLCPAGLSKLVERFFALPIWHPFAQLIFPIYLFHFPFIVVGAVLTFWSVDREVIVGIEPYQVFVIYAWAVLFTTLFSAAAHVFLEKPFLTMRNKSV